MKIEYNEELGDINQILIEKDTRVCFIPRKNEIHNSLDLMAAIQIISSYKEYIIDTGLQNYVILLAKNHFIPILLNAKNLLINKMTNDKIIENEYLNISVSINDRGIKHVLYFKTEFDIENDYKIFINYISRLTLKKIKRLEQKTNFEIRKNIKCGRRCLYSIINNRVSLINLDSVNEKITSLSSISND